MVKAPSTYGLAGGSSSSSSSTTTSLARLKPPDDGIFSLLASRSSPLLAVAGISFGLPALTPYADTRYSVGINIRVSRVDAGSSGRGAGHQINTTVFIQSCIETDCLVSWQETLEWKMSGNQILTSVSG